MLKKYWQCSHYICTLLVHQCRFLSPSTSYIFFFFFGFPPIRQLIQSRLTLSSSYLLNAVPCLHCTNSWQSFCSPCSSSSTLEFFSYHFLLPIFFLHLSRVSLNPYPPAICPRVCLPCAGCCWTFSARSLFSSSPPTLLAPLVAPSCQFLSGQLTGCCRAFPATRATGKRPSVVLFDVPSPLILYTWTVRAFFSRTEAQVIH